MPFASHPSRPVERLAVATATGFVFGVAAHAGLRGLGLPVGAAGAVAASSAVALVAWLAVRLPRALDGFLARRPGASVAWLLVTLIALVQTTHVADSILAPDRAEAALRPRHACLTASTEAVRFWREGVDNIYRSDLYLGRVVDGFHVDPFFYSPPYLLVPIALLEVAHDDFRRARAIWFAVGALALLLSLGLCISSMDDPTRLRALALAPALWASLPVQLGLQMSNPHALVVGLSMTAWVLFARRPALAGPLLALASTIKLFPALFLVDLAVRRRGRAIAWTVGALVVLVAAGLAVVGTPSFRFFFEYQLPRLSSGEACAREFARPFAVARNLSPLGLPSKLALFGIPGMTLAVGQWVAKFYAIGLLGLALIAALRVRRVPLTPTESILRGLALLALASLSGPYAAADYSTLAVIWLICVDRRLVGPWVAGTVALLSIGPFVLAPTSPGWIHALGHAPMQIVSVVVPVLVLLRRPPLDAAPASLGLATTMVNEGSPEIARPAGGSARG